MCYEIETLNILTNLFEWEYKGPILLCVRNVCGHEFIINKINNRADLEYYLKNFESLEKSIEWS